MKSTPNSVRTIFFLLLLAGLSWPLPIGKLQAEEIPISIDYRRNIDFSKYRTYAWRTWKLAHPALNPQVHKRIVAALETQMEARGLQKQTEGRPDLFVTYHAGRRKKSVKDPFGPARRTAETDEVALEYTQGTLIVDLLDGKTMQQIWRGVATAVVSEELEENEDKVDRACERLFAGFPPGKK